MNEILWVPSDDRIAGTHLRQFMDSAPGSPSDYQELWEWSVSDLPAFWDKVWHDCGVIASQGYERVMGTPRMPGTEWFSGARLNFSENLLRRRDSYPALIGAGEGRDDEVVTHAELYRLVARAQQGLADLGVGQGDRVAAFLPNCVEAVVAMLATTTLGAIWSSTSPDFGPMGVVDRFGQIAPRVLIAADGYRYNGATHRLQDKLTQILQCMEGIEHVVAVDFAGIGLDLPRRSTLTYDDLVSNTASEVAFRQLPFDHPLYVMFSSGTTGPPKSIVHGAGGTLVKHLCEHMLHTDLHAGQDVIFWFTSCGWMMWNWLVSALACEATLVLYVGSPSHPSPEVLWRLAERTSMTHFGTSPKFLAACEDAGVKPSEFADLSHLRAVLSTGAPLNPRQFDWVYDNVADDVQLASISGGTDLIGLFGGGVPTLPVRRGELQARTLGMAVEAWNERGEAVIGEKGELICTKPFPSMPLGFWGDEDDSRYHEAYFTQHPGVWTHGDLVEIRPEHGVIIYGRSDTTLNPGGVRIGTGEIYRAIEPMPEIVDSLVVDHPVGGDVEVVLFVKLTEGIELDDGLRERIRSEIRTKNTPRHVPARILAVSEVPYTLSGKKVEQAVRKLLAGEEVKNRDALANPASLDEYAELMLSD